MMNFFLGCFLTALLHLFPANVRGGRYRERGPYRERMPRRYRTIRDLIGNNGAPPAENGEPRLGMPPRRPGWRLNEEDIISNLRARTYNRMEGGEALECSICREPIDDGQCLAELDCPCQFSYHFSCMRTWLMDSNSCPTCRQQALNITDI